MPGFEQLLELNGGDLGKFYEAADKLAHEPKAERHRRLRSLGDAAAGAASMDAGALISAMGANFDSPRPAGSDISIRNSAKSGPHSRHPGTNLALPWYCTGTTLVP